MLQAIVMEIVTGSGRSGLLTLVWSNPRLPSPRPEALLSQTGWGSPQEELSQRNEELPLIMFLVTCHLEQNCPRLAHHILIPYGKLLYGNLCQHNSGTLPKKAAPGFIVTQPSPVPALPWGPFLQYYWAQNHINHTHFLQ